MPVLSTIIRPSGDKCPGCDAPEVYEPHVFIKHKDGSSRFTMKRVIEHDEHCPTLERGDA